MNKEIFEKKSGQKEERQESKLLSENEKVGRKNKENKKYVTLLFPIFSPHYAEHTGMFKGINITLFRG